MNQINLVSVSSGKDSTATLLLALKQFPDSTEAVFADTGNEHDLVYEYLDYLESTLGIRITCLRTDFSEQIARKAEWVRTKWPEQGVPAEFVEWALELLTPTGNPFLDLCLWKGTFPIRRAQFCTEQLKTMPLTEHAMDLIDVTGRDLWSWQGVRRDESQNRRDAAGFEKLGGGVCTSGVRSPVGPPSKSSTSCEVVASS